MLHASYDPALVVLSIAVAVFASYTSLDLASRIDATGGRGRTAWLVGAAVALGGGIWSMHFIAMLAFSLGMPIAYGVDLTIASLAAAIAVVGIGLYAVHRWPKRLGALLAAGAFTGSVKIKKKAQYRAAIAATATCGSATSPTKTVKAKKKKTKK